MLNSTALVTPGVFCLTIILCYVISRIIQNVFFSTHKSIPGPFWYKASSLPLFFADLSGNRTSTIHTLHKKYGSVVRIAPNELSFSGINHIKDIYGQSSLFMKSHAYDAFGRRGVFNMRNKEDHRTRRKLLSHPFSQVNIYSMEPLIVAHVNKLCTRISNNAGSPVDVLHWFRMLALDIVGEMFLGRPFGALDDDVAPAYAHDLDNFFLIFAIDEAWPAPAKILRSIGPKHLRHLLHTSNRMYKFGADAYQDYIATHGRSSQQRDLLSKLIEAANLEKGAITDYQIENEISNLIFAGTDTTSTSLTYLFWELSQNSEIQQSLYSEIQSLDTDGSGFAFTDMAGLKFLDAVVNETLRIHPAAPASLSRVSPDNGGLIGGMIVPAGTIVSMQCYTTHRDPAIFHDPDRFDPNRWLKTNGGTPEMKEAFMPFTKGTRACLGKNLALMELKMITAMILRLFHVSAADEMTTEDMEMQDRFLLFPKGKKCKLVFTPRS